MVRVYLVARVVGAFAGVAAAHVPLFFASRHARVGGAQMFSECCGTEYSLRGPQLVSVIP
jgi:hypothetical protein